MTKGSPSKVSILLKLAAAIAVLGTTTVLFRDSAKTAKRRCNSETTAAERAHSQRGDLITYGVGYLLALLLTCIAFALVHWRWTSGAIALGLVYALALVQAIVHFRCFLHVDLKRSARDDLHLERHPI